MNWDAIGALAELAGALGVIASLVYLAIQIRQNTRSAREAAWHSVLRDLQQFRSLIAQDPEVARVYRDGLRDYTARSFGASLMRRWKAPRSRSRILPPNKGS
jgi:hypothetical protein